MSFVSDIFKVGDLGRLAKFCKVVGMEYEDVGNDCALVFSHELVEPPCSYVLEGREFDIDFDAELHKLAVLDPGQTILYRVEYEVGIHSNGEVEYWNDELVGMPDMGDSDGEANVNAGRVFKQAGPRANLGW